MSKYNKEIVDRMCGMLSTDSFTITEVCKAVGISEETFHTWKREKAEFSDALKKARDRFDEYVLSEAKKSLVKLVQGYTVQEKRTVTADTGKKDDNGKAIVRVKEHSVTEKYVQPNTAAVIFSLTNRDSANWKNRLNSEVTGADGKDLIPNIEVEIIDRREQVKPDDTDD